MSPRSISSYVLLIGGFLVLALVVILGLGLVPGPNAEGGQSLTPVAAIPNPATVPPVPTQTRTPTPSPVPLTPTLVPATEAPTGTDAPVTERATRVPPATRAATAFTRLVVLPPAPAGKMTFPTPTVTRAPRAVRLQLPAIAVDTRVVEVGWTIVPANGVNQVVWDDPASAAGHMISSANPGEGGNIVFMGHNNIEGKLFLNLWQVKVGDEMTLTTQQGARKYRVSRTYLVHEKNASPEQRASNAHYLDPTAREQVTIISCFPPTNNTDRVIVIALPEP